MIEYSFLAQESRILLYAGRLGLEMGLVYDLFRVLRRVWKCGFFWTALMDLCFWGFTAYRTFYMVHTYSNGTLRWFAILGVLAVVGSYMKFFSSYVVRLGVFILGFWKRCGEALLKPVKKLARFFVAPFGIFVHLYKKCLTKGTKMSIIKIGHCNGKEKAHGKKNSVSDEILQ